MMPDVQSLRLYYFGSNNSHCFKRKKKYGYFLSYSKLSSLFPKGPMKNGFKSGEETEHLPKSQRGEVVLPLAERTGLQEEKGQEGKEKVGNKGRRS